MVVQSLLAARADLETTDADYRAFQLFGYDFVLDTQLRVWLCEVNASPAVAETLLPGLVQALIDVAIDTTFAPEVSRDQHESASAAAARSANGEEFELLYRRCPVGDAPVVECTKQQVRPGV
jgi:hypothetical protein